MRCAGIGVMMGALLLWPDQILAQEAALENKVAASSPEGESKTAGPAKAAGKIITQPARDVGAAKTKIPPVLAEAREAPYSLEGLTTCDDISNAAKELNEVLGPDFNTTNDKRENRAGKLAQASGKTVVNALIPFRGLVREISGAAPAQRRLNAAIDAGYARRGFLRGVHHARGCQTIF